MKRLSHSYTSGAADVTGFAALATGASWPLTATTPTDGLAHLLTIKGDQATDHSLKTVVVTGTDENGIAQTETLNLPNGTATVTSTKYWLTVTSPLVPSATIGAETVGLGWAATSVTPWVGVGNYSMPVVFNMGFVVTVDSGSPTYTVQGTYNDSLAIDHATVAAQTITKEGAYTEARSSVRLKFTAAGTVSLIMMVAHL